MKGSFWWKQILKLLTQYKGLAEASAECGETILFWSDLWNGRILSLTYPHLHSFAKNGNISVKDFVQEEERHLLFNLPLSEKAFDQFCDLEISLQAIELNENKDRWKYIWGNENFSSAKAYKQLIGSQNVHPAFHWLWRSSCQQNHKVFFLVASSR
jgi:hypothetical protein